MDKQIFAFNKKNSQDSLSQRSLFTDPELSRQCHVLHQTTDVTVYFIGYRLVQERNPLGNRKTSYLRFIPIVILDHLILIYLRNV